MGLFLEVRKACPELPDDSSSQLFGFVNHGQYIFSRPGDATLPGRHGFVKDGSLLLKIKMMHRLLNLRMRVNQSFSINTKKGGGERGNETFLNFFNPTF